MLYRTSRAYWLARSKTRSSSGPKVPWAKVMSLAMTTMVRPAGNSGVASVTVQATMPILLEPGFCIASRGTTREPSCERASSTAVTFGQQKEE